MVNLIDKSSALLPARKVKVPPPPQKGDTFISVNGTEISSEAIGEEAQNHAAASPADAQRFATHALIVRQLLLQRASVLNIVAKPEILGKGLRETDADARIRQLLDIEINTPTADEKACQRYFDLHPNKFRSATIYETSHILFAAPTSDPEARQLAKQQAEMVIAKLETDPSSFAQLARNHSDCPSKEQGGNLGQLTKGATVPEFETVLFQLSVGQMSPAPAPTRFGYHIIRLENLIEGQQLPFEFAREKIAAWLEASSWSRAVSQYISLLSGNAKIIGFDLEGSDTPLVQ